MCRLWQIVMFLEETYHPWEIEEIVCIWSFAGHTYSQAIKEIHSDFRCRRTITNPEEAIASDDAGPAAPVDMDELVERYSILKGDIFSNAALKGIIDRGLELLHTVLVQRTRNCPGDLLTTICTNLVRPLTNTIPQDPSWEDTPILERRSIFCMPKDITQRRRDPLPFTGDGDATAPPLAWTILWKGTYSNVFGAFLPQHMRRWGHVMWDSERVQKVAMDSGDADITRLQRLSKDPHDFRDVIEDLTF